MKEVKNITVLGAGAMGAQIAALAAEAGYIVVVRDIETKFLDRGRQLITDGWEKRVKRGELTAEKKNELAGRLSFIVDVKEAVKNADLVIEAVPEIMELKKKVAKEVSEVAPDDMVFATNTSSLSIAEIAQAAKHPERVVGTHYFNPPSFMPLLEIVHGKVTSEEAIKVAESVAKSMRRTVIHVKDVPGFVANRIFCVMSNESDWAIAHNEAKTPLEVDSALKFKLGLPMGLLELEDTLGGGVIDVEYHVMEYFAETLDKSYHAAPLLESLYKSHNFGKKTGKGYYDWTNGQTNEIPMNAGTNFDPICVLACGVNESAKLIEIGATTRDEIDTAVLLGLNFPRGILRMADSEGIDNIVNELNRLYSTYKEERYKPSSVLTKLVAENKIGRKTGEGFYSYGFGKFEFVKLTTNKETRVTRLVLNRANRANSLNMDFVTEINKALDEVENDNNVRCVIISGAGSNFCGGADVSAFASGKMDNALKFSDKGQTLFTRMEVFPKPIIAAINGAAMGGGLELALACDIRIMSRKAQLRFPELTLGLIPGWGGTQRAIRLIGGTHTKEMVLLADPVTPDKAMEWGLVNYVAEPDKFEAFVDEIAVKLANGAPLAQKMAKALLYYGAQADQRTGAFIETEATANLSLTKDLNEGITSLFSRRAPKFKGQ
jgi:enoyl-CoA hydratase / 3-hydroxyacyl-CoA dehydrogenase